MLSTFDLQGIRNQPHSNGSVSLYTDYVDGAITSECGVQIICLNTNLHSNYTFTYEKLLSKDDGIANSTCFLQGYDIDNFTNSWKGPAVNVTIIFKSFEEVENDKVPNSSTHNTVRLKNSDVGIFVVIVVSTITILASLH
ncbi:PREDICTED: uncharacterized protein LOC109583735 [Amphimedon queenslandica]|nr:PREDICTED: uncharacterized protein LOC109583735 [Amphimedon queenslandica]|eukprot:XP_019854740.1 PREDICTED: uncharacterized protein LOC109583735 [Amphimedon queenslandica]